MIIDDLDIHRPGRAVTPLEANSPIVVNTNAMLPSSVSFQRLEPVSGQCSEILQVPSGMQPIQARFRLPRKAGKLSDELTGRETLGSLVSIAEDHGLI